MSQSFRLVTANLLHERGDAAAVADLLDTHRPDVVVIQELGPAASEVISARFPHHRLLPAADFTGRGIATRFPARFGEFDMPRRPGIWAVMEVDGTKLRIGNVHFANPISFPWWSSVRARSCQLDALFEWLEEDGAPTVVAGDFNASPIWPVYKRVSARLTDVVSAHAEATGVEPERTWGWRPGWRRLLRIDHVFATPGLVANAVSVEPLTGSDHWALVVDLEFG